MKIIYYFLLFHPSLFFYLYRIIHRKRGAMEIDDKKYQQEKTKNSNNLLVPILISAQFGVFSQFANLYPRSISRNSIGS